MNTGLIPGGLIVVFSGSVLTERRMRHGNRVKSNQKTTTNTQIINQTSKA